MRRKILIGTVLLTFGLSACSSGGGNKAPDDPVPAHPPQAAHKSAPDAQGNTDDPLALGKPVQTDGSPSRVPGGGPLELTPTDVVYAKGGTGPYTKARNGLFAVISVKEKATRAAPAAQAVSLDGGGWKWVAPDGRATDSGSGNGAAIVQGGGHGNIVQPGTYDLTQVAFDIPEAARGGTLMFLDARGHIFRWKVPAKDSGPGAAELARKVRDDLT